MNDATSLWLHTAAAIALLAGGLWLHLRWHAMRREFSEAWDFVSSLPWLTVLHAALLLLAFFSGSENWLTLSWINGAQLGSWSDLTPLILIFSALEIVTIQHSLLPSWPWSIFLPLALVLLSWRVIRFPYRYGPRRQKPVERWLLLGGTILCWLWLSLETSQLTRPSPEWLDTVRLGLRWVFQAMTMAFSQIVIVRLVIAWMEPEQPDDQKDIGLAIEHTFARWRGVVGLAVLDLLILLMQNMADAARTDLIHWVRLEVMVVFLPVPAAVASVRGELGMQGMSALKALWQGLLALASVLLTSLIILSLVRYASVTMMILSGPESWPYWVLLPVHALVLATVRNWVFLAIVLTLLRHGLNPSSKRGNSAS